jgi:hypothetical protein
MNYTKPELNILGEAKSVIEQYGGAKIDLPLLDGVNPPKSLPNPAYDLDE